MRDDGNILYVRSSFGTEFCTVSLNPQVYNAISLVVFSIGKITDESEVKLKIIVGSINKNWLPN